jgi:uncharacterized protein YbcV (DUF1398 family)
MCTLAQTNDVHDRLGQQTTLAAYVRELGALGVERFVAYVRDGHSEFFGRDGQRVSTPPAHALLTVAGHGDPDQLSRHLERHTRGETTYEEMSQGLADSGVEQWTVETAAMTWTYYDRGGVELLVERIDQV